MRRCKACGFSGPSESESAYGVITLQSRGDSGQLSVGLSLRRCNSGVHLCVKLLNKRLRCRCVLNCIERDVFLMGGVHVSSCTRFTEMALGVTVCGLSYVLDLEAAGCCFGLYNRK